MGRNVPLLQRKSKKPSSSTGKWVDLAFICHSITTATTTLRPTCMCRYVSSWLNSLRLSSNFSNVGSGAYFNVASLGWVAEKLRSSVTPSISKFMTPVTSESGVTERLVTLSYPSRGVKHVMRCPGGSDVHCWKRRGDVMLTFLETLGMSNKLESL